MCHTALSHCSFILLLVAPATTETYTLSLHDALPILARLTPPVQEVPVQDGERPARHDHRRRGVRAYGREPAQGRSEEHTSELQSHHDLVCRLLLEKKK